MAPAGYVDSAFGNAGVVAVQLGNGYNDVFNGLTVDPLDRVVVVGTSSATGPADIAVVRVHGGDQRLFVQQDANHNVTSVASRAGVVIDRYHYTPYGSRTVLNADFSVDTDGQSDADFRHGHQGLAIDQETGLYYNRARLLHPTLGRFTQRDPLGYVDGMSVYQYVRSGPTGWVDPSGTTSDYGVSPPGSVLPDLPYPGDEHADEPSPPFSGTHPAILAFAAVQSLLELNHAYRLSQQWNLTSPAWSLSNECGHQASELERFLHDNTDLQYWRIAREGGRSSAIPTPFAYHHVVSLVPKQGNPLDSRVIDPFKPLYDRNSTAVDQKSGKEFREDYPYSCGDSGCKNHPLPPTKTFWEGIMSLENLLEILAGGSEARPTDIRGPESDRKTEIPRYRIPGRT